MKNWHLFLLFFFTLLSTGLGQERWVFLDNGHVRLGVNLSAGACIGWFSHSKSSDNLLNSYDEGRYLQQSFYGDVDGSDWNGKPWRYNPVQGGSWKGEHAVVLEESSEKTKMHTRTRPRHWATGAEIPDVEMEQWIHLEGGLVKLRFKTTYNGEKMHKPTHQEMPALFVQPSYDTLVICAADQPEWKDVPVIKRQPGFPNESVKVSEPWCAWVNKNDQGIGLYFPHTHEATAYRFRGGGRSDCSYIAPIQTFSLQPEKVIDYTAVLALGTSTQIRAVFKKLATGH